MWWLSDDYLFWVVQFAVLSCLLYFITADLRLQRPGTVSRADQSMLFLRSVSYVATDSAGLTSTSTRTVIIEAANENQPPLNTSTTTTASSNQ
jgi:hypothetical protein